VGVTAVIGLQWGDEGKGKIVDALTGSADVVVRCQGGANAGHTVFVEGRKHVLHLVPSGILRDGVMCLIGNGVVVDLDVLASEIAELEGAGISTAGRLLISRRAHVVLPIHRAADAAREELRGDRKLGTTRRGIGPCYSDKFARVGIRVGDVLNAATLPAKIETVCKTYGAVRPGKGAFDADSIAEYCERHRPLLGEISGEPLAVLRESIAGGKEVILEGSQGFLLDIDHGTYPFVTSCNTGTHGLACGAGLPHSAIDEVVGVAKAYMTRVGEGPLPTMMEEPFQTVVREAGQEYGATTGRPRRCGWLDLVALRHACELNGVTSLAVTKLDTLAGLESLKVCVAYEYFGTCVDAFPPDIEFLRDCVPRYARAQVWEDLGGVSEMADLPPAAADYVERIRTAAGAPIGVISVGPGRDELINVDH
jgi:adenylosuccinate synthase